MDFVLTKNSLVDLNVFFYKKGFTNIHKPFLSLLKIDSSKQSEAFFHIGFKQNMGYSSSNPIITGVMIFEVLEGYPLQSILFTNNSQINKPYKQSLEELDAMDFYCIQKRNEDPWGDFVLKNVRFIDTKYNQSTDEFSRRIVATFVAESKEAFRIPFFFNNFKSDVYSNHIVRNKEEIEQIKKDITFTWDYVPKAKKRECSNYLFERKIFESVSEIHQAIDEIWKRATIDTLIGVKNKNKSSPIYRLRDFIACFYKYSNELNYKKALARGDLDFLKFINIDTSVIETNSELDRQELVSLVKQQYENQFNDNNNLFTSNSETHDLDGEAIQDNPKKDFNFDFERNINYWKIRRR